MHMQLRTSILSSLNRSCGTPVSGVALATQFSVSRMAICKAVQTLCERGYPITSIPRKGYVLEKGWDVLGEESLSLFLSEDLPFYFHPVIDSTNTQAKVLLGKGVKPPFLVIAERQEGGRGRRGRDFSSPASGTYFSLVLSSGGFSNVEKVTTATAVGVADAIEETTGENAAIKWVNDIYYKGKKAVGILCEGVMNLELGTIEDVIIGVGTNYTTKQFPPELEDIAVSLFPSGVAPIPRAAFISKEVAAIRASLKGDYLSSYRKRCFVVGQEIRVIGQDGSRDALALGVDDDAHLIVRYKDGSLCHLSSGEVSIRPCPSSGK